MKKITSILIVFCTLLGMFCFSSCNSAKTNEPSEPEKAKEEIELERALQLAEEGAWGGAYLLLDDLMERGYYLDYKDKRDAIYEDYLIAEAIYRALSFKNLKDQLKNPDSLVIYNVYITAEKSEYGDYYIFAITYDYGASNSFGGMVRDTIDSSYTTKEAQKYVGKTINYSHVDLTDIAKLSSDEWRDKLYGDFRLYHHNLRNDEEGNIWG